MYLVLHAQKFVPIFHHVGGLGVPRLPIFLSSRCISPFRLMRAALLLTLLASARASHSADGNDWYLLRAASVIAETLVIFPSIASANEALAALSTATPAELSATIGAGLG